MRYPNADILVSPQWLMDHIKDENLVIVDCPWAADSYTKAHIPGAVCRPGHTYIKRMNSDGTLSVHLQTPQEFEELCSKLGIDADCTEVAYDEWGSIFASRLWWMLRYYGHQDVKVLDGGWQGWVISGYSVSYISSTANGETKFKAKAKPDMITDIEELKIKYNDECWNVLDVRSDDKYNGKAAHGNKWAGHIPGAIHVEWNRFLTNSRDGEAVRKIRSADEIHNILTEAGLNKDKTVVTHCHTAVRATYGAFVLALMGYPDSRVYDGSMAEWANRDDTPLE
jgi:thiosulfate/3-mercaptopyruvate sulfurtransferase